jgi:hypothetical protein
MLIESPSFIVGKLSWSAAGVTPNMRTTAFLLMTLVAADASTEQKPTTGYAPVNGLKMYYEIHGSGEPVVLLHATKAPMFFIHGDADAVRLEHIAEMFRLKGGEIHGDLRPRSASRLAILANTTQVTLIQRMPVIVPMVNHFLDANPLSKAKLQGIAAAAPGRQGEANSVLEAEQ